VSTIGLRANSAPAAMAAGRRTPATRAKPTTASAPIAASGIWTVPIQTSLLRNSASQVNSSSTFAGNEAE
jgi:hypothetical protein